MLHQKRNGFFAGRRSENCDRKKHADDKRGARFISHFTKPSRSTQEEVPAFEWHFVTDKSTGLVSIGHREAQTLDVFLQLIREGVTECAQMATEMKVSPATVSRPAKKAIDDKKIKKIGREYRLIAAPESEKNDKSRCTVRFTRCAVISRFTPYTREMRNERHFWLGLPMKAQAETMKQEGRKGRPSFHLIHPFGHLISAHFTFRFTPHYATECNG